MASRQKDWLWQAERDIEHARASVDDEHYEWACFAAQQGAEKAIKAVFQSQGASAWGHSLVDLMEALKADVDVSRELTESAKELDKHYIGPRYPNSVPNGAPGQVYTRGEAERAIDNADRILRFCQSHVFREG